MTTMPKTFGAFVRSELSCLNGTSDDVLPEIARFVNWRLGKTVVKLMPFISGIHPPDF